MYMPQMVEALRIEVQDTGSTQIWEDTELIRAIQKSVALMSRMIPKRAITETQITIAVEDETLTIDSSTGTLTYKPVKAGSVKITGEVEDTDFTVNYLTGVVTEIGSLLADGEYTVNYKIDPYMLDISSLLSDYIKIERVEYPVGANPATYIVPNQEIFATYLVFKEPLTENSHLRITYLTYWTPPTATASGDYPRSLDNAILVGSAGQALIFKAEKYVQSALTASDTITTVLAGIDDLSLAAPSIDAPDAPDLPGAPSAPDVPSLDFSEVTYSLDMIASFTDGTETGGTVYQGRLWLTEGELLINVPNPGQNVAENYARYAEAMFTAAKSYGERALSSLKQIEDALTSYSAQVTAYGSAVNAYANGVSGVVGLYREENNTYQASVAKYQQEVAAYTANIGAIISRATQLANQSTIYLNIAGRYLASGQAKINEMLTMLGLKAEYNMYHSLSEQFS